MSSLAIVVLVSCALAWSGFDLVRKLLVEEIDPIPLVLCLTGLQIPLFVIWALVAGEELPVAGYWGPALLSVALNLVANVLFVVAIKVSPLSVTVPLLSFTPVFTTILARPLLGEVPGPYQLLGVGLVVVGALALHGLSVERAEDGSGERGLGRLVRAFRSEPGALMMLGVALLWSIAPPLDKLAMEHAGPEWHGAILSLGVALGLAAYLTLRGRLGSLAAARRRPGLLAGALVVSFLALGLQLVALQMVFVSLVETVKRGLGNLAAAATGALFFQETVRGGQWLALLLMGAGVALILL